MPEAAYRNHAETDPEMADSASGSGADQDESIDMEALLSILSDDYAREILKAVSSDPLPAPEIADRLDFSKPTVYRRLNRLEEIGVVETSLAYDPDGHHRKQFQATLDQVVLSIDTDDIAVDHAFESDGGVR
jgi:DNA-binding transcriptional ArsR family regulator